MQLTAVQDGKNVVITVGGLNARDGWTNIAHVHSSFRTQLINKIIKHQGFTPEISAPETNKIVISKNGHPEGIRLSVVKQAIAECGLDKETDKEEKYTYAGDF